LSAGEDEGEEAMESRRGFKTGQSVMARCWYAGWLVKSKVGISVLR
jgi:hypothetical protein